jgi:cytochrome c biogenesis factor
MARSGIIVEYVAFLRQHKRWWIVPLIILVLILGGLLVGTRGSPLAPIIYTIF